MLAFVHLQRCFIPGRAICYWPVCNIPLLVTHEPCPRAVNQPPAAITTPIPTASPMSLARARFQSELLEPSGTPDHGFARRHRVGDRHININITINI